MKILLASLIILFLILNVIQFMIKDKYYGWRLILAVMLWMIFMAAIGLFQDQSYKEGQIDALNNKYKYEPQYTINKQGDLIDSVYIKTKIK
jgi:hypothetical protein